jgi:cell filamentation protein, protein adenylyltransferase
MQGSISSRAKRSRRPFLRSHPWVDFCSPVGALQPTFWLHVGAAESKCVHIARSPLKPELAAQLHQTSITKGARATTAIEGNTLTEEQVAQAVRGELEVPPSQEFLKQEASNVIAAFNELTRKLILDREPLTLTPELLEELNGRILEGMELADGVVAGRIRTHSAVVGRYRGAPAEDCRFLVELLCEWINGDELRPPSGDSDPVAKFYCAFLRATLAHLYLAWIHPFGDGNGRLSRLVEFAILIEAGVPLTAAHLLSHHYNLTRSRYYTRLEASSQEGQGFSGVARFLDYAVEGFADQLSEQILEISRAVFATTWREYVYDSLPAGTPAQRRQRKVALELPGHLSPREGWVRRADIRTLTPEIAQLYVGKGPRTLARDINRLIERDVVVTHGDRIAANSSLLLRHMPSARDFDHSPIAV